MATAPSIDLSQWLTDAQVCARLGFSQATLDREVKRGHLHPLHRSQPRNRPQRVFDPDEVASRMPAPPVRAAVVSAVAPGVTPPVPPAPGLSAQDADRVIARLVDLVAEARKGPKPWLDLNEAAGELGLSRRFLWRLVMAGALDAVRDGRGGRIKVRREDLGDLDVTEELIQPKRRR